MRCRRWETNSFDILIVLVKVMSLNVLFLKGKTSPECGCSHCQLVSLRSVLRSVCAAGTYRAVALAAGDPGTNSSFSGLLDTLIRPLFVCLGFV